jgi:hypothetical protein
MSEIIERLKECINRNRPILIRPKDAEEILIELGIRLWK